MMNNLDSLCFKVFKARFFPDYSILEAKDSITGSYAWKSILSARDVIRKGMVWQTGNGQSVRIKEDKCLPVKPSGLTISPLPSAPPDAKLSSLINPVLGVWKSGDVKQVFLPHEALMILGIPLSPRSPLDRVIWAHTQSGLFTTKSAYELLVNSSTAGNAGSSVLDPQKRFWRGVWQLRVPEKIKHFMWRACNNALPTKCNLARRQITATDACEFCNDHPEDVLHALWHCKEVESVWSFFHWSQTAISPPPLNFCDLFDRFLQVHEDYRKEFFALIAWCLWNRHNSIHFGRPSHPLS